MIEFKHVSKQFGNQKALDDVTFTIEPGSIVGLLGPNGAGKTTLIKTLLGQSRVQGDVAVLGMVPNQERHKLMEHVSYIADVAILPAWMKVWQVIEYFDGVHPKFDRNKAVRLLEQTDVTMDKKVKQLSKGMIVQLHLACVLAIDVNLLVLDEPTLGLDILYRKQFYDQLISEFYDDERIIIITSHQVDEIEYLLNRVMFLKQGKLILNDTMEAVSERYVSLQVAETNLAAARKLNPIHEKPGLGKHILTYKDVDTEKLQGLGQVSIPSVTDLFTATMKGVEA